MKKGKKVGIVLFSLCLAFISMLFLSNNRAKASDYEGNDGVNFGNAAVILISNKDYVLWSANGMSDQSYWEIEYTTYIEDGEYVTLSIYSDDGMFEASSDADYTIHTYSGSDPSSGSICGQYEFRLYEGTYTIVAVDVELVNSTYTYSWVCQITLTVEMTSSAPIWYTADVSSIKSGSSVSLQLTTSATLWGYSSASSYYKYVWTISSSAPSSGFTAPSYSSKTSTKIAFSVTAPTVSSSTTYYLWIQYRGKDTSGNVSTFSGKTPYYQGTAYNSKVAYKYTITAPSDTTAPVIKCGSITLSSSSTSPSYSNSCSLVFTDNMALKQYEIHGDVTDAISGTSFTYGTLSTEGSYTINVKDAAGNTTTGYLVIDNTAPSVTCGGTILSTNQYSPIYKNASCSLVITDNQALLGVTVFEGLSGNEKYTSISSAGTSYTYGNLSDEGIYAVVVSDKAGNSVDTFITIDKTKPVWYTSNVSTISSGASVSFQLTEETEKTAGSGIYNYSSSTQYMYVWALPNTTPAYSDYIRTSYTSQTSSKVAFTTTAPIVSEEQTYYLWIYNVGQDNAGNVATYSGKVPYTSMSSAGAYLKYSYTINPPQMSNIVATASVSNGKITFTKASSNTIQETYKNGTVRYFVGKPDIYDSNLSEAFDKYGVTVSASTFFASSWTSPQGLIGEFKLM